MYSQKMARVSKTTNIIGKEQKDFLSLVETFKLLPYWTKVTKYSEPADEKFVGQSHFKAKCSHKAPHTMIHVIFTADK